MTTTKPFKPSAGNHRRLHQDTSVRYRHSAVMASGEEREELLLRWGLFQTYGVELLENDPAVRNAPSARCPNGWPLCCSPRAQIKMGQFWVCSSRPSQTIWALVVETIAAILRAFARQDFVALGYRRIDILDFPSIRELAGTHEWEQFGDQGKERHGQMHLVRAQ